MSAAAEGVRATAEGVRAAATRVAEAGTVLWEAGELGRARWLAQAFATLADASRPEHTLLVEKLVESSGLSEAMVRWSLSTTFGALDEASLLRLASQAPAPSPRAVRARSGRLCAVILSGNVCTAAARALAVPLLFGWPVLAKASTRDDVLAWHLAQQLSRTDPRLGAAVDVTTFAPDDQGALSALLEQCDALSAFGSDGTLDELRAALGATATFLGHGHGLGLGFVPREALASVDQASALARQCALDVAAYDQRGCLSPHALLVEEGGAVGAERFAELLFHEGLEPLARELPRGALPLESGGVQLAWRGVGAAHGRLLEGDGFAVSFEPGGGLRLSPGYRNVQVLPVSNPGALTRLVAPLGVHLKCLSVAAPEALETVAALLPARVAPRLCRPGAMQTPPGDALSDALGSGEGLVRWVDLDGD